MAGFGFVFLFLFTNHTDISEKYHLNQLVMQKILTGLQRTLYRHYPD